MKAAASAAASATSAFRPLGTMSPAVRTGLAAWDQRRLPLDEFAGRVRAAGELCRAASLDALVAIAHASHPAAVTYFTNFRPTARVGAVVIVPGNDPVLIAGMGGRREAAYQRTVTWIADLVQTPFSASALKAVLAERGVSSGRLGVAGLDDELPVQARDRFVAECTGFELVTVDAELAALRRVKSPHELAVLAEADSIAGEAARAGTGAFCAHRSPSLAAVAMERTARMRGCGDVRLLLGHRDGSLRPFEHVEESESDLLVCYLAAEFRGYWAERAFTFPWARLPAEADLRPVVSELSSLLLPGSTCAVPPHGDVELELRGLGLDPVSLPDAGSRWLSLDDGDAVSLVAGRVVGEQVVLHSQSLVVTAAGPRRLAAGAR